MILKPGRLFSIMQIKNALKLPEESRTSLPVGEVLN